MSDQLTCRHQELNSLAESSAPVGDWLREAVSSHLTLLQNPKTRADRANDRHIPNWLTLPQAAHLRQFAYRALNMAHLKIRLKVDMIAHDPHFEVWLIDTHDRDTLTISLAQTLQAIHNNKTKLTRLLHRDDASKNKSSEYTFTHQEKSFTCNINHLSWPSRKFGTSRLKNTAPVIKALEILTP